MHKVGNKNKFIIIYSMVKYHVVSNVSKLVILG
jgi:hypothetical protein